MKAAYPGKTATKQAAKEEEKKKEEKEKKEREGEEKEKEEAEKAGESVPSTGPVSEENLLNLTTDDEFTTGEQLDW